VKWWIITCCIGRIGLAATGRGVLQQQSGRDSNSLMADARFVDPAAGDYRVQEGSPALTLGFRNFPMDRFGVQKPQWKEIARTPDLPAVQTLQTPDTTVVQQSVRVWLQARVRELEGEEFSAFGVSRDAGGVHLAEVPDESLAAASGLRTNDVVQSLNGQPVKRLADLYRLQDAADGRPLTVGLVRGQQPKRRKSRIIRSSSPNRRPAGTLSSCRWPNRCGRSRSDESSPSHRRPTNRSKHCTTADWPRTMVRCSATTWSGGKYRVDLGSVQPIAAVRTWSYHQHGKRGSQHWTLYASASDKIPAGMSTMRTVSADRRGQYDGHGHRPVPSDQRPASRQSAAGCVPLADLGSPSRDRPPREHGDARVPDHPGPIEFTVETIISDFPGCCFSFRASNS
jgi:hypothetical protein